MYISKDNLESLIREYLEGETGILRETEAHAWEGYDNDNYKAYSDNLFINISEEEKTINIRFVFHEEYNFQPGSSGEWFPVHEKESVDITLSAESSQRREDLLKLSKEAFINYNCLHFIISLLKKMQPPKSNFRRILKKIAS